MVKVSASLKVLSNPNRPHSSFEENEIDVSSHGQHKIPSFSEDQDRAIFDSLLPVTETPEDASSNQMRYLRKHQGSQVQLECEAMNQVSSGSPDILYWTEHSNILMGDTGQVFSKQIQITRQIHIREFIK